MPMNDEVRARIESVRLLARQESRQIVEENQTIVSIALAGSWAMGIPSPVDVDLVLLFEKYSDIRGFSRRSNKLTSSDYSLDLHCYSCKQMEHYMFRRKSNLKSVKCARLATRKLRSYPGVKKFLLKILQHNVGFLKLREGTPQAAQILLPFVDKNSFLFNMQEKQKAILVGKLTECEEILHQPDGFYQLLEAYLDDRFTRENLKPALLDFYGDSKEFLRRAIHCYRKDGIEKLHSLYEFIYENSPKKQ